MSILKIIEEIAGTASKLTKESIILREKDNETLKRVFVAAYNPRVVYGIKAIPQPIKSPERINLQYALNKLSDFSDRVVSGGAATELLAKLLGQLEEDDAVVLSRIILRDLRMGCSDSTINKVHSGLISEYPYMRYNLFSKVKHANYTWKDGVYAQTKMDGMWTSVNHHTDGTVTGLTRQGGEQPEKFFSDIFKHIKTFFPAGYQYHGEVLVDHNGKYLPREEGNGITNSIAKGGELPSGMKLVYVIWDAVPISHIDSGVSNTRYSVRFSLMNSLHYSDVVKLAKTKVVNSMKGAFVVYNEALAAGEEGIMLKSGDLPWKDHTTSLGAKLKLSVDVDLKIVGFTEGNGKYADLFGAVMCETSDGLLKVNVSGFKEDVRKQIHATRAALLGTIMTVTGNEVMLGTPASIFLPRFAELRADKKTADTLQQVIDQFENAKQGK
jgi:DNA ligase-1